MDLDPNWADLAPIWGFTKTPFNKSPFTGALIPPGGPTPSENLHVPNLL